MAIGATTNWLSPAQRRAKFSYFRVPAPDVQGPGAGSGSRQKRAAPTPALDILIEMGSGCRHKRVAPGGSCSATLATCGAESN